MSNEDKINAFFNKIKGTLDEVYTAAQGSLDGVFVQVDNFVDHWHQESLKNADRMPSSTKGEQVKVKPSPEQMVDDLASFMERKYDIPRSYWRDVKVTERNRQAVEDEWNQLPDDSKSWQKRDKNSPL
jgi:hypothetical protein